MRLLEKEEKICTSDDFETLIKGIIDLNAFTSLLSAASTHSLQNNIFNMQIHEKRKRIVYCTNKTLYFAKTRFLCVFLPEIL